jgi:ABC-type multidrug transport system ATPase subunit
MIGHTSPEIFAAFPRNMGLTVAETIGSGFEGVFSRRTFTEAQQRRIREVLKPFEEVLEVPPTTGDRAGRERSDRTKLDRIYDSDFSHFPANQQAIFLLLRAIVSRPRLLVLDEFSQTIDERAWEVSRDLLNREWTAMRDEGEGEGQAVVVVSHYEAEVPWEEGKVFRLNGGKVEFESS